MGGKSEGPQGRAGRWHCISADWGYDYFAGCSFDRGVLGFVIGVLVKFILLIVIMLAMPLPTLYITPSPPMSLEYMGQRMLQEWNSFPVGEPPERHKQGLDRSDPPLGLSMECLNSKITTCSVALPVEYMFEIKGKKKDSKDTTE